MPPVSRTTGLHLATGRVTTLLGPDVLRRRVLALLDPGTARCPSGHPTGVVRLTGDPDGATARACLDAIDRVRQQRPQLVLVDRLTEGLDATGRREVLSGLTALAAAGPAVLVDDPDPVAALAVADAALRVHVDGSLVTDDLVAVAA